MGESNYMGIDVLQEIFKEAENFKKYKHHENI